MLAHPVAQAHRKAVAFRACGAAVGIPRLHLYALRYACVTRVLQKDANIAHVQEILGHSQITTTAEYAKIQIDGLKKIVERSTRAKSSIEGSK